MGQKVIINEVTYNNVNSVAIPLADYEGEEASFYDISDTTATSGEQVLASYTFYNANGTKQTGAIPTKTGSNITASGATVTVPSGYYGQQYTKDVASGSASTPATSITANPSISASGGTITASVSASQSVTPTVSAGYVSSGTAGTVSVSGTATATASTLDQNLVASNIKNNVTIFGVTGSLSEVSVSYDSTTHVLSIA